MPDHYEMTDQTRTLADGTVLHRIRATRDLGAHGVTAGDLGGWIEHRGNLEGRGWVFGDAWVRGLANVSGNAQVSGNAWVSGAARVSGDAWVFDDARVFGAAWVFGDARVSGAAWMFEDARVFGNAWVRGDARVSGDAQVFDRALVFDHAWVRGGARVSGGARVGGQADLISSQDILTLDPIGSENSTVTLYRSRTGHHLRVGCWTGSVDTLAAEVDRRARVWSIDTTSGADRIRWRAEYAALGALCRARISGWAAAEPGETTESVKTEEATTNA